MLFAMFLHVPVLFQFSLTRPQLSQGSGGDSEHRSRSGKRNSMELTVGSGKWKAQCGTVSVDR